MKRISQQHGQALASGENVEKVLYTHKRAILSKRVHGAHHATISLDPFLRRKADGDNVKKNTISRLSSNRYPLFITSGGHKPGARYRVVVYRHIFPYLERLRGTLFDRVINKFNLYTVSLITYPPPPLFSAVIVLYQY